MARAVITEEEWQDVKDGLEDIQDIKAALLGPKINGKEISVGLLGRVKRIERGGLVVICAIGLLHSGRSIEQVIDWLKGLL